MWTGIDSYLKNTCKGSFNDALSNYAMRRRLAGYARHPIWYFMQIRVDHGFAPFQRFRTKVMGDHDLILKEVLNFVALRTLIQLKEPFGTTADGRTHWVYPAKSSLKNSLTADIWPGKGGDESEDESKDESKDENENERGE
ncbi:hypothetical protein PRZ48_006716 [Zasmidium cellare]|uniref:Uncharacterized protein n=1 Tax=Zasmidium cellare TaxID=395010 RepID=A0ABR0ER43_ZASCE|nr:hypothetical protein PRZ48_006716 [Zasmidium cellare]